MHPKLARSIIWLKNKPIRFLSNLFRSTWLYFPGVIFLGLAIISFTQLGQGRDILVTFTETGGAFGPALLNKYTFIIAISFWLYVSWYSSRIISYTKTYEHKRYLHHVNPKLTDQQYEEKFAMELRFRHRMPRLIGYGCLVTMITVYANLAYPQSLIYQNPFVAIIAGILACWLVDRYFIRIIENETLAKRLKVVQWITGITILLLIPFLVYRKLFTDYRMVALLLSLFLLFYMLYINLRRKRLQRPPEETTVDERPATLKGIGRLRSETMRFLHFPREEFNYFFWFNLISLTGLIIYIAAIVHYPTSTAIGPVPFIILAFSVLLGFGNILTVLSVKFRINLHLIVFLLAAFLPTRELHRVRTVSLAGRNVDKDVLLKRQSIAEYFRRFVSNRPEIDSVQRYPVYMVLANGGASRAAYWVASVLGRLEDSSRIATGDPFSRHVFAMSGTSGGGVGLATFYAQVLKNNGNQQPKFEEEAKSYLRQDFLTFTLARMLGNDFFNYIPPLMWMVNNKDRAYALEKAFESANAKSGGSLLPENLYIDQCISQSGKYHPYPILCINTTRVQDGNPAVIATIRLDTGLYNRREDLLQWMPGDRSLRLSTAAILGARFPFISPAGRLELRNRQQPDTTGKLRPEYYVDGGYFDNSGAGFMQEMIRAMTLVSDTTSDKILKERMRKLEIIVLHITNSPQGNINPSRIGSFKNDLLSPLLTILGAYDMQTTVNDRRMETYTRDLNKRPDSAGVSKARYYPIHLYRDITEPGDQPAKEPYTMNWFISDTTLKRMDKRLNVQPKLNRLLRSITHPLP
ncbi:hypothetical protein KJS94_11740 [Flavihumibacter rivuli]|uniref:hypothetical protein n=1 Tax=Flavihumibacter rivuli TaxID=2838156 RepID=UPI001BDE7DBA|nr:hypothetical protein [Flavihumibacter rivuli]ULQ55313.1 hypothetical protein KJS94_11740 [Flavihumibacter rivuli]